MFSHNASLEYQAKPKDISTFKVSVSKRPKNIPLVTASQMMREYVSPMKLEVTGSEYLQNNELILLIVIIMSVSQITLYTLNLHSVCTSFKSP